MRVEPKLDEVVNGERGMRRGIELCLERECLVSAVTLLFSAIDALSALSRPIGQADTTRAAFNAWVDRFLLPASGLRCTAVDLYAARCGVLHTYSSASGLARTGNARQLVYQWRKGPAADTAMPLPDQAMVIEVESLWAAFQSAAREFLVAAEADPDVRDRVRHHLPSLLCYTPWPQLSVHVAA